MLFVSYHLLLKRRTFITLGSLYQVPLTLDLDITPTWNLPYSMLAKGPKPILDTRDRFL